MTGVVKDMVEGVGDRWLAAVELECRHQPNERVDVAWKERKASQHMSQNEAQHTHDCYKPI